MEILEEHNNYKIYRLDRFWDDEFKHLDYINEPFNDSDDVHAWLAQGYQPKICGDMADMRGRQPRWNQQFVDHFAALGWKNIGTSYYRMTSGTVMPVHQDRYVKYVSLFDLEHCRHNIRRAVILLEDWKSGHYLEIMGQPVVKWHSGTVVEWVYDAPHMAANIGLEDRYTLQITGHL
jgi:hypothetical protein